MAPGEIAPRLDMLMLDYPADANCDSIRGQWKAFEARSLTRVGKPGVIQDLGVSTKRGTRLPLKSMLYDDGRYHLNV